MKINGEEVELVTDFATLRAGMIVWQIDCLLCGGSHRGMLVRLHDGPWIDCYGDTQTTTTWCYTPDDSCGCAVFDAGEIDDGKVFRVVDPKLSATTARKREAVRP